MRPRYMLHMPCRWIDFRQWRGLRRKKQDGDTVGVTMISKLLWRIRIKDVDSPELGTPEGIAAKHFVEATLEEAAHELSAEFEAPDNIRELIFSPEPINVLDWPSFNRVVGDIWVGESDLLSELLINAGHAVRDPH